jgi:hypothetical protein
MNFALIHNVSEYQLRTIFIARLSVLVIIFHHIFVPLRHRIRVLFNKSMSMMKLLRYLQINPERIPLLTQLECQNRALLSAIARYCSYDSRKQRLNYAQELSSGYIVNLTRMPFRVGRCRTVNPG